MDVYVAVKSNFLHTAKYVEDSDIGTTYLGITKIKRQDKLKA